MVKDTKRNGNDTDFSEKAEGEVEKGGITDLAKKVFLAGLGAMSMGERIPKEAVNYILDQAERKKDDIVDRLAIEVSKFLEKLDVSQELKKALQGLEIDLQATLKFSREEKGDGNSTSTFSVTRKTK